MQVQTAAWWSRPLALVGVVGGLFMFVIPGYFAWESYSEWRKGWKQQPTLAWVMGAIVCTLIVLSPIVGPFLRK